MSFFRNENVSNCTSTQIDCESENYKRNTGHAHQMQPDFPYTRIPNRFLDEIAIDLTPSELRVILYIYRHTLGYNKFTDQISYNQFVSGIVTRDGRRIDQGAGVSRRALVDALISLEKRGLITRFHQQSSNIPTFTITLTLPSHTNPTTEITNYPAQNNYDQEENERILSEQTNSLKTVTDLQEQGELTTLLTAPDSKKPNIRSGQKEKAKEVTLTTQSGQLVKQVQNLHSDKIFDEKKQVQNLHERPGREMQKLHSTIKNKIKQNKIDRGVLSRTLADKVTDLSVREAEKLIEIAETNGRDEAYLLRLTTYVTDNPAIYVPAAVLTTLVKTNQDRTSTATEKFSYRAARSRRSSTKSTTTCNRGFSSPHNNPYIPTYHNSNNYLTSDTTEQAALNCSTLEPGCYKPNITSVPATTKKGPHLELFQAGMSQARPVQLDYAQLWQTACQQVTRLWDIPASVLIGGSLVEGNETGQLVLKLNTQDAMVRLRLSQTLRSLVGEGYQISW
jgi:DNA-binding MarR family transcriptional regulator